MLAARTVAPLAAYVPLRHLLGVNIVIDGMAAVARRRRGPLHIIRRIKRGPPIGAVRDKIRPPHFMGHVPLCWLRKIVIPDLREVPLFPDASVDQRHLLLRKLVYRIRA